MRAIFLPLILLLTLPLQAGPPREVTCRFIKMEAGRELTSVVVAPKNGDEIMSPLPANLVSAKIICFATDNTIAFLSGADKSPVATAKIPKKLNSALLIFFKAKATAEESKKSEKGKTEELSWQILVVDDSGKNPGKGGALVANCNSTEIRCTLGSEKKLIPPLKTYAFEMPKNRDDFNMALVKLEAHVGDRWNPMNENSLRFTPGIRYLIFSFTDNRNGRPRVNIVRDSK